jgi:hypothetical protein
LQLDEAATGEPVLWLRGSHFEWEAGGQVLFPGRRYLTFPVSGTGPKNAVMTSVSESGRRVLWFRETRWTGEAEVIVSPDSDVTPEVLCVIELTADWLSGFFRSHPGGGG